MGIEGKFKARAVGQVVLGTSQVKGTPFIEFYLRISEGEHEGQEARFTGYFSDSKSGKSTVAERTVQSLQYCGWAGDDLSEFTDGELHGLDGSEVQIVVEEESYEKDGETRTTARVQWINKLGGYLNIQNAMTKDAAASFADRMRGLVVKQREKNLAPPSAADVDFPHGENAPKQTGTGGRKGW